MTRRKVVTTVSIDPEIFEMGREENMNFSQTLQRAIIDGLNPQTQIRRIDDEIIYYEKEITKLKEEKKALETVEQKHHHYVMKELIDRAKPRYEEMGLLPNDWELERFCIRLGKTVGELKDELICIFSGK